MEARRPDNGHKWQEGYPRPLRGEKTGNGGADAIDQKHPDLPLRGEGQSVRRPQHGIGRRGHDGRQRAGEHDGRDPGPTDQSRRNALDAHSGRGDDDETIETDAGDRPVEELPRQGEDGEKASFERKKPTDRAWRGNLSSQRSMLAAATAAPARKPANATKGREAAITSACPSARPSNAVLPVIADGNTSPRLKKANASMLPDAKPSSAKPTSPEFDMFLRGIDIRHVRHVLPRGGKDRVGPAIIEPTSVV